WGADAGGRPRPPGRELRPSLPGFEPLPSRRAAETATAGRPGRGVSRVRFRRLKRDAPLDIVLPITPMLDMSFQLLAFFILTFRPSNALEGQMDMALPRAGTAKAAAPERVDPFASSDTDV